MKVDSRPAPIPEFKPIVVIITCESTEEMRAIAAMLRRGAEAPQSDVPGNVWALMKPIADTLRPHFTPV